MEANGVNMVAIGLEHVGEQEFVDGAFFDGSGGKCAAFCVDNGVYLFERVCLRCRHGCATVLERTTILLLNPKWVYGNCTC